MAQRPWDSVLVHIRSLATRRDGSAGDAELLHQFISHREESAFEALLRRHGPMVLSVARRVVGNETDAEDVFQATFLLLARRAAAIRMRESVGSWLHGVAHRLALSARAKRGRRQIREREAAAARSIESPRESAWSELEAALHEVLEQLPAKYRTPLVHCYLEGWTQEEVARQLGKPLGTVRSWLARGRELLRKRLLRRGITLSGEGASAALLASACATAEAVPPTLRMATLSAAHQFAVGENTMTLISPAVSALVRKRLTAMLIAKLKSVAVCVLVVTILVAGSGWAAHRTLRVTTPEAHEAADRAAPTQPATDDKPRADAFGDPLPPGAIARLGTMRFRHEESRSWEFAVSPDSRTLATASGRSLILHDMATGRRKRRFPFSQVVRCVAYAPDGKSVVVGGEDNIVYRIELDSGKELQRFAHPRKASDPRDGGAGIWGAMFTSDGTRVIAWSLDHIVRVWEVGSGEELRQLGPQDFGDKNMISDISPDGKLLAITRIGTQQSSLHLWDLKTGKESKKLTYSVAAGGVAISPDGRILAISDVSQIRPGRIVLVDVESGKELAHSPSSKGWVSALAFSRDGKTLASAGFTLSSSGNGLHLWDVSSVKELRAMTPISGPFSTVLQLAFSPDGKTIISRSGENHVRLWDVATGKERNLAEGPSEEVRCLAYSPNAKRVASVSENRIWLWSANTGKLVRKLESPGVFVSTVAFSEDGKSLASANTNGTLCLWDPESGKEQRIIETPGKRGQGAAFAPDGETIAVWSFDVPRISLWSARTGKKCRDIDLPPRGNLGGFMFPTGLHFSSDSKVLYAISGTHTHVLRWDAATGRPLPSFGERTGSLNGMAISPDGRSVAVITGGGGKMTPKGMVRWDGELHLWETATGQRRFVVKDVGFATSLAFSPDGSLLALVNAGNSRLVDLQSNTSATQGVDNLGQVRLVRVADGKVIHRFSGHLGGIGCIGFSPDGRTLASGGHDSTVLVWDVTDRAVPRGIETPSLNPEKLAELWKGLSGTAEKAHGCMWTLIAVPGQAVPFLGETLKPVAVVDAAFVAQLLKKLESDQFSEREEATQQLKKMGDEIEPALRKALQEKPPLETRRRLQALLDDLEGSERLRSLRAIEVLERIGDKPARDLLRRLSEGAAGAWRTDEARMSLRRLEQRGK